MSEQQAAPGAGSAPQGSASGSAHPAQAGSPVSRPANPPPEFHRSGQSTENPRSRGISPARDRREQQQRPASPEAGQQQSAAVGEQGGQQTPGADKITINGHDWTHEQVSSALAEQVEAGVRKAALPQSPDGYELKLPADFQAPQGVKFEFDRNSQELKNFQRLAHARGLDQQTFSEALGIYAANKIGEQQNQARFNDSEKGKLGSAADQRIGAVETWLKARVGAKADKWLGIMKSHPVAEQIEIFESLMRQFSDQGSASYTQSGRVQPDTKPQMPANLTTFEQKRAWQDQVSGRGGR